MIDRMGGKPEYSEGSEAGENFLRLARAVLKTPKVAATKRQPKTKSKRRKTGGSDNG
jgi:hypothetical protein